MLMEVNGKRGLCALGRRVRRARSVRSGRAGEDGPVRCQHRRTGARLLSYPRTPTAAGILDIDEEPGPKLQVAVCKRCGGARLRLYVSE